MRKIREVLRLHFDCGFRQREIARAVGASPTTVGQYVRRMERAGLSWEASATLSDDELEARLYPPPPQVEGRRPEPHWPTVRRELSRKGVTLDLLWNEYKAEHPDGYAYTWFCTHYSQWANSLPLTLRQTRAPGVKLFVDYSGMRQGARSVKRSSSSRYLARRTTRTPKRPGRSSCQTGSARTCVRSNSSVVVRRSSSRTT